MIAVFLVPTVAVSAKSRSSCGVDPPSGLQTVVAFGSRSCISSCYRRIPSHHINSFDFKIFSQVLFFFFPFFAQNSRIWILGLTFCVVLLPLFVESTSAHKSAFVNVYKILLEIQVLRGKAVEVLYEVTHNACFSRKCFYYQKRL